MNPLLLILLWLVSNIGPLVADSLYRRQQAGRPLFARCWSVLHIWWAFQAILIVLLMLTGFQFAILGALARPLHFSLTQLGDALSRQDMSDTKVLVLFFLPVTVLQNVAFFFIPAGIISKLYHRPLRSIGLPPLPPRRSVIAGLLLGIGILLAASLSGFILEQIATQFKYLPIVARMLHYEQTNPVAQMAQTLHQAGPVGLFWGFLAVAIAAPIGEEMLFRGFALNILSRRFGNRWGLILSALLFAAPHTYSPLGLTVIFLMGLALGHIYRTGGSLWTTIFIHAVNNGAQILIAYFLTK